jgi:glycosyltransferase involved in cell wall biosynthesis
MIRVCGRYHFTDDSEGLIVPIRDAVAIANRLQKLADNAYRRIRVSEAALRRVESIRGGTSTTKRCFKYFRKAFDLEFHINSLYWG